MADPKVENKIETTQSGANADRQLTPAELLAQRQALQKGQFIQNPNDVETALEGQIRAIDQRQERQLYASTWAGWSGIVSALTATTSLKKEHEHRKAMERIRDQMFDLLAKEEKRRKLRDSPSSNNS